MRYYSFQILFYNKPKGKLVILLLLLIFSITTSAQKQKPDNYKEESDAIRKAVWAWDKPEFAIRAIPAEYANASRVIIARHIEIIATGKNKAKGFGTIRQLDLMEITREIVKINDKAAVNDYSEISFTQLTKRTGLLFNGTTKRYIGVRIIKPGGAIQEIDAGEILLTKDEKSTREAKVAIPDLQAGDIIDYFLAKQQNIQGTSSGDIENYVFPLFDNAPVLNYSIHIETGDQYAIEYRDYNGAPEFEQGFTENNDNRFDISLKNLPPYAEEGLWISAYRQLPIVRMNLKHTMNGGYYGNGLKSRQPGMVYANPPFTDFIADQQVILSYLKTSALSIAMGSRLDGNISKYYFDLVKNKNNLPLDSIVAGLYYLHRYMTLLDVAANADIDEVINRTQKTINRNKQVYDFGALLRSKNIGYNIVLATPHDGPLLNEILSSHDIDWMILMGGDKKKFFGINDIFSPAFYLPYAYENTKEAITFDPNERFDIVPRSSLNIPGSSSVENSRTETININLSANNADLDLTRRTIVKGHYKPAVQEKLILFEDYCNAERKLFGEDKTMIEELENTRKSRKSYASELQSAFDKERNKQKDEFISEAKEWFDQPITGLTDYKVENLGVRHNNPDFIYSSKFSIEGLVKKAGNNMIIDIGKLQGTTLKATPNLRKRKLDIYMPFACSIQSQITLQIPDGYTAEGINELNKKVENKTGYFIVEATSDGKTVTIKLKKSYNHAFESIGNWDKMVEFIEAASDWSNSKILLKKK